MSENEIYEPAHKQEHYSKLIAALRSSPLAAAWEEFKNGGIADSDSGTRQEAAGEGSTGASPVTA